MLRASKAPILALFLHFIKTRYRTVFTWLDLNCILRIKYEVIFKYKPNVIIWSSGLLLHVSCDIGPDFRDKFWFGDFISYLSPQNMFFRITAFSFQDKKLTACKMAKKKKPTQKQTNKRHKKTTWNEIIDLTLVVYCFFVVVVFSERKHWRHAKLLLLFVLFPVFRNFHYNILAHVEKHDFVGLTPFFLCLPSFSEHLSPCLIFPFLAEKWLHTILQN